MPHSIYVGTLPQFHQKLSSRQLLLRFPTVWLMQALWRKNDDPVIGSDLDTTYSCTTDSCVGIYKNGQLAQAISAQAISAATPDALRCAPLCVQQRCSHVLRGAACAQDAAGSGMSSCNGGRS